MSQYTELLNMKAETLSLDDDNYEEKLLEVSTLFRGFDEALTAFIEEHGYTGDLTDIPAKAQFLREKFKAANVKQPRDFKEWFVPNKKLTRKTAFQICFAFGLGVDETNDFFRCVQFERGFDCHTISEAVYYFCMRNGLSYTEAQEIIDRIPMPKKVKAIPNREVLYTGTIIEYINSIDDKEKLIQYIKDNINNFQYNNATAIKYIKELWTDISKEDGLAVKEGAILDKAFNRFRKIDPQKEPLDSHNEMDRLRRQNLIKEAKRQEKYVKPEDYVIAGPNAATWTILSQIMGLDNYSHNKYEKQDGPSLNSVLEKNALLPLKAAYCFPSKQNINALIRGEFGDNETTRKMLIFLVFYTYWAKLIISKNDAFYSAKFSDSERCLDTINAYLLDAGYPELYAGNPYDWLFKWALNDENSLIAFRHYMGEVFAVKEENTED